jgi:hypothetical protein
MTIIQATLDANNGVVDWTTMLNAIPNELRRFVWEALNALKEQNLAAAQNRYDPERGGVFEIVRLGQ